MKKFPLIVALITATIIIGGVLMMSKGNKTTPQSTFPPTQIEYYWLTTCPHCKNVADFISTWDKKDQVTIEKMEVASNKQYAAQLLERGKTCGIAQQELGSVPLMVTPEGQCYLGDTPIIDYLKSL